TYKLELLKNDNTNWADAAVLKGLTDPYAVVSNLEVGKYYKWRVSSSVDGDYLTAPSFGIFKVDDNAVTAIDDEDGIIPESFRVSQNYPNPFNPSTVIKYGIPEASFVTIKIYNILGSEIATLVNTELNAGIHQAVWNGRDNLGNKVSSGTYILRVTAGNNSATKKMLLLK
ncbi:MAG: T9SS type A sorting domain-containing protein, partial [Chlorobi bacterium]|nr:T9SS type A sorting domain-containing protein [Chlorobiota bacterium]